MTTPLSRLQKDFQAFLLGDDAAGIHAHVTGTAKVDAGTRLSIYADAYVGRLVEVLGDNYPALHALLGDERFGALARTYVARHPSGFRSIRWYGDHMTEFVSAEAPWNEHPVIAEMARFEWLLRDAFDAADAPVLGEDDLAALPAAAWPGLRIGFHPSLRRLDLRWGVPAFWQAVENGEDPQAPQAGEYPVGWIIWRRELRQFYRSLDVSEAWALDAALGGAGFADICEGLCEWIDPQHVALHAAGTLKRWLADGMISRLDSDA